ncbi:MAG: hypothetical protein ACOCG6_05360 [Candidatus Cloacimonadaceae bacterium]
MKQYGINDVVHTNYYRFDNFFMLSYESAFNILYKKTKEGSARAEVLCHSMLFLARHAIELGLKWNIRYLKSLENNKDVKCNCKLNNTHNLSDLLDDFKKLYENTYKKIDEIIYDEKLYNSLKDLICGNSTFLGLAEIDNNSIYTRYPHKKDGKPFYDDESYNITISMSSLHSLFNDAISLLAHIQTFLKYLNNFENPRYC